MERGTGGITITKLGSAIIEFRTHGYITRQMVFDAERQVTALTDEAMGPYMVLRDALALDSFEPGVPAAILNSLLLGRARVVRTALVAQSRTVVAVASAFRYLLPSLPHEIFADRDEALAFLSEPPPAETRRSSRPPRRTRDTE